MTYDQGKEIPAPTSSLPPSNNASNGKMNHSPSSSSNDSTTYAVGTAPDDFYTQTLPPWRAALRKTVMKWLNMESEYLSRMQKRVRSPILDAYFLYSSSLGTHTCFMLALPALYFFGFAEIGRGLVVILGFGVYLSSFLKDLVCAPRPYSPPVERLTIGSHHLEYGFPSTHSTNSVSIALYVFSLVRSHFYADQSISAFSYVLSTILLAMYALSIVFGRLYLGMHSMMDCAIGSLLGAAIWAGHALWWRPFEDWLVGIPSSPIAQTFTWLPSWSGAIATIVACAVMVHKHPQPADDCPCFEDAIAIISVVGGVLLARFASIALGVDLDGLASHMPGNALSFFINNSVTSAWRETALWSAFALLKLILGISLIFAWRLLIKFILHSLLPPLFRFLARRVVPRLVSVNLLPKGTGLPSRRFYTPATEYDGAVPEGGLHPIPSVIDLNEMMRSGSSGGSGKGEGYEVDGELGGLKRRHGKGRRSSDLRLDYSHSRRTSHEKSRSNMFGLDEDEDSADEKKYTNTTNTLEEDEGEDVKHYDADVLTKVIVYAGIGVLASGLTPLLFEYLAWGVNP